MTGYPDYETLSGAARCYCDELLPEKMRLPGVPVSTVVDLPDLSGKRVVLWDVYGTLLAGRQVDLEGSLGKPEAMLQAFELTARKFGFSDSVPPEGGPADRWLRGRYIGHIEHIHRRKKKQGFPSPEVRIEEVWEQIIAELEEKGGYRAPEKERPLLPWNAALYFEIASQQAVFYSGAPQVLLRLREMGIRQGIVSNAQFYTPLLLELLLKEQISSSVACLDDIFEPQLTVYSYRLGRSKPDPQIFSGVLDVLVSQGLAAGDALYIGNDMLNDVATAGSAGFATVLFAGDRHSLNLRLGEERVRGVKPTAVISSYGQLPLMISGAAATSGRTLRLGILHHHLLPGGVSSVIRDTLEALAQHGAYQRVQADLFADLSRADGQAPGWVEELGGLKGLSLKAHHLPQLAYDRSLSEDRAHFLSEAEKQRDLLIDKIRLESCDLDNPYVLYIHNTALGKNPCLSAGLALFAEWAARERLPLLILNQTHDFAELHRPGQERIWRMATPGMDETERLRWEFPALPNMVHAGLTVADRRRLISTGLPAGATHVLPNSVGESWTAVREQVPAITDSLGGRPYLLAPQKVMRRKNTLEALVVLACLRSAGFDCGLVVTLPASSEADRKYEELVRAAVEETGLPAIIGIERTLGDKAPPFEQVVAGCAAFLTASVMEGFGQSFLEGWVAGRMVLGRRIEDPCSDFEDAGVDLGHLYRKLLVRPEWITGGLEALKQEYRTALGALRSELGFPPLKARQFEQQFARHKVFGHKGLRLVDFADLSPGMQAGVACLVAGDRGLCSQALELNPWVNSCVPGASGQWEELIKRNRQAVLRSFGPAVRARRLRSIILAGTAAMVTPENPVPGKRSLKEVLSETVSLEKTRLLFLQA